MFKHTHVMSEENVKCKNWDFNIKHSQEVICFARFSYSAPTIFHKRSHQILKEIQENEVCPKMTDQERKGLETASCEL
jgi:hypothetical protein